MTELPRKKSPRAPSFSLDDAIERALRIYDKERRHAAPVDVVAKHLGYKNASNGTALTALATLRYYGLVERPREGMLAASKDLEAYKFAPEEKMRRGLILKWLKTPPLFSELIEHYKGGLPSDATIKFDLIQRGFNDKSADAVLTVFRRSLDYANYYEQQYANDEIADEASELVAEAGGVGESADLDRPILAEASKVMMAALGDELATSRNPTESGTGTDRIPVRLSGGRRAWIEVPTPFFSADKARLKAQIDLLLADDEEQTPDV